MMTLVLLVLWLLVASAAGAEPYTGIYPDPHITPGAIMVGATVQHVCMVGVARDERHVTEAMKREVFRRYGLGTLPRAQWGTYEVDHLISLELGGSNNLSNLWPEPYGIEWGARRKDVVETCLHRRICRGEMTLEAAQTVIRTDWVRYYEGCRGKRK